MWLGGQKMADDRLLWNDIGSSKVILLIGADHYSELMGTEIISSGQGLTAQSSKLGWLLHGPVNQHTSQQVNCVLTALAHSEPLSEKRAIQLESSKRAINSIHSLHVRETAKEKKSATIIELEASTGGEKEESSRLHRPGIDNPADLAARGAPASMLVKSNQLNKAEEKSIKRVTIDLAVDRPEGRKPILNPVSMLRLITYVSKLSPQVQEFLSGIRWKYSASNLAPWWSRWWKRMALTVKSMPKETVGRHLITEEKASSKPAEPAPAATDASTQDVPIQQEAVRRNLRFTCRNLWQREFQEDLSSFNVTGRNNRPSREGEVAINHHSNQNHLICKSDAVRPEKVKEDIMNRPIQQPYPLEFQAQPEEPEEEDQPAQDESIEPTQPNNKAASAVHPPPEEDARKVVIPREENDIRPPRENVVNAQQCQKSQSGRTRNPTRRLIEEG